MNANTKAVSVAGPAGAIECAVDLPAAPHADALLGTAVICHPHPQQGGTMDNKVVMTIARAALQLGWRTVRFNFRGVGSSEGTFDEGNGEALDLQSVVREFAPEGPLALAGFSFGAFVTVSALQALWSEREVRALVLVGTAASRFQVPPLPVESHERALVIHGEKDETVPLGAALDWARPQSLPITVVPGVEHFFHGQLPLLKTLVMRHLRSLG